jgi:hypothetical protein
VAGAHHLLPPAPRRRSGRGQPPSPLPGEEVKVEARTASWLSPPQARPTAEDGGSRPTRGPLPHKLGSDLLFPRRRRGPGAAVARLLWYENARRRHGLPNWALVVRHHPLAVVTLSTTGSRARGSQLPSAGCTKGSACRWNARLLAEPIRSLSFAHMGMQRGTLLETVSPHEQRGFFIPVSGEEEGEESTRPTVVPSENCHNLPGLREASVHGCWLDASPCTAR